MNIEDLIKESLKQFLELQCITDKPNSKLVFPIKRGGKVRISEQEVKLIFIRQIEQNSNFQYSVEVPTKEKYKFSGEGERSGNIDVCLYEDSGRKHLIEFKALNPKQSSYNKDFEKLIFDENDLTNYFIQVIEKSSDNGTTVKNIEQKYIDALADSKKKELEKESKNKSHLIIFLCDMSKKTIFRYKIENYTFIEIEKIKANNSYRILM